MQDHSSLVNQLGIVCPSPEQPLLSNAGVEVFVKRDDLLHPVISGNKWRKLQGHLYQALQNNTKQLISFGGGYSNHLHALGYCCFKLGIQLIAIVRGDYTGQLTPMLEDLMQWNAQLQFVIKQEYKERNSTEYLQNLQQHFPTATIIPEGGSDPLALEGMGNLLKELENQYDYMVCPVASGATLAGLAKGIVDLNLKTKILGIAMLKGEAYLEELVGKLLPQKIPVPEIIHDYHCGGYAKSPDYLQQFCSEFTHNTKVPVEPVYSGKMFYAVTQLIEKEYFPAGSRVLALHTGGLQGARQKESS